MCQSRQRAGAACLNRRESQRRKVERCDGLPPQNGSLSLPWMRRTCSRSRTIFTILTGSSTA